MQGRMIRHYQRDCITALTQSLTEHRRVMVEACTGCGKTVMLATFIKETPGHHLIVVSGDDLIRQLVETIERVTGEMVDVEQAGRHAHDTFNRIVVASIPSLSRIQRLGKWAQDHFGYVHYDEFHGACAPGSIRILDHFNGKLVGWTATGFRSDKKKLPYDHVAFRYTYKQAVDDGWLVPFVAERMPLKIDARGVHIKKGDYDLNELDEAIEPYLAQAAREVAAHPDRHWLCFLPLRDTSRRFTDLLNGYGVRSTHVDGETDDREGVIGEYVAGQWNAMTNAQVFVQGTDVPIADSLLVMRCTRSVGRFRQMAGRVFRPLAEIVPALNAAPDAATRRNIIAISRKPYALILDPLWLTAKMDMCSVFDLVTEDKTLKKALERRYKAKGRTNPIDDEVEVSKAGEGSLVRAIKENQFKKRERLSHDQLAGWGVDLDTYTPSQPWQHDPITEGQLGFLAKQRISTEGLTKGSACYIMDKLIQSTRASPAQVRMLASHGINAERWTKEDASKQIDALIGKYRNKPRVTMYK